MILHVLHKICKYCLKCDEKEKICTENLCSDMGSRCVSSYVTFIILVTREQLYRESYK